MSQNTDLRVRRTHKLIRDAFMHLIVEHEFDQITIQDIADKAMINRSTFYRHYIDKYDLIDRLLDDLFGEFRADAKASPHLSWQRLFEHVARYAPFYKAMLGKSNIPRFAERVRQAIETEMAEQLPSLGFDINQPRTIPFPIALRYLATAQIGIVSWWLENDMPCSPTQAANYLVELHLFGAVHALGLPMDAFKNPIPPSVS